MSTKARIAASRRNAKKSTGPKTPEGKAKSSMNALRHGLRSQKAVLPSENQEDFNQVHAGLQDLYQPQTVAEQDLVEQAVLSKWKLVRAEKLETDCYLEAEDAGQKSIILNRITQIQTRLERSYFKAYKELERIKAARAKAAPQAHAARRPRPTGRRNIAAQRRNHPPSSHLGQPGNRYRHSPLQIRKWSRRRRLERPQLRFPPARPVQTHQAPQAPLNRALPATYACKPIPSVSIPEPGCCLIGVHRR